MMPPTDEQIERVLGDPNVDQRDGIITMVHYCAARYADAMRRDLDPEFIEDTWGKLTRVLLGMLKADFDLIAHDPASCARVNEVMKQVIENCAEVRTWAERRIGQFIAETEREERR